MYIDCREKKTYARKLIKWHKLTGETTTDINQEVLIDTVEDDFDRLFIEHGMMSKCGSMTHTQYNNYNRQSLISTEHAQKPRTQIIID